MARVLFMLNADISEPLGLLALTRAALGAGHEPGLVRMGPGFLAEMRRFRPHVVASSLTTGRHKAALKFLGRLKQRFAFISVVGGPHPTFSPDLVREPGVDAVCRGEGEGALVDLLEAADAGRFPPPAPVPNLIFLVDGEPVESGLRPLLPAPGPVEPLAREMLYRADPFLRLHPVKSFMASRGCPHACAYCVNAGLRRLYGVSASAFFRRREPEFVIREIAAVKRGWPLGFVRFFDDIFPVDDPAWLDDFADRYRREIGLPFSVNLRPEQVDAGSLAALKRAGLHMAVLGIESGSGALRRLLGRPMADELILDAAKTVKSAGVRLYAQNMLAVPFEGIESDLAGLRLNAAMKPDFAWASLFHPYPGAALTDLLVKQGFFDGDWSRIRPDFYHDSPLDMPDKGRRRRLAYIFTAAVGSALVGRNALKLARLPLDGLYRAWRKVHNALIYGRLYPGRPSIGALLITVLRYLKLR